MNVKLLLAIFLLVHQFSFSQTEKLLKGVVSSDNFLVQNVEIINKTSKTSTITNEKGEFIIQAKANDSLYFYAKEYNIQRIKLTTKQLELNNLEVSIYKKPEELKEVVVTKMKSIILSKDKVYEQGKLDDLDLEKKGKKLRTGVYDGTIENGADLNRIFGMVLGLFIKEKERPNEKIPEIEFVVLAKNTCDQKFYLEKLKLKPDEVDLFLQFCNADPKSKTIAKDNNILSTMDFLTIKNIEFKKL